MIDGNKPAFPTENEKQTGSESYRYEWLTKREYFAAMAMQAIISNSACFLSVDADYAVTCADRLLEVLSK